VPRPDIPRLLRRRGAIPLACALCAALLLAGCEVLPTTSAPRTLTFSVPKVLFGSPTATNPADQGPGIDTVSVTINLAGGSAPTATASKAAFSNVDYGSFTVTVDGQLTGITASGTSGGKEVVSASVTDYTKDEMARYSTAARFGDLTYFKLDWSGGDSTTGTLRILPCPRSSADVLADAGAQTGTPVDGVNTDRFSSLQTLQVAVQPVPAEDISDGSLTSQVYYAVSAIDPSVAFSPATLNGTYLAFPWTAQWTWAEVTSTGKRIGDRTFTMTAVPGDAATVGVPDSSGKLSTLIDLSTSATAGQYLLYAVVLTRGGLSVPTDVRVLQIR